MARFGCGTLKDYGLQHIHYSGFIGDLRRDELNSLLVDLKNLIEDLVENMQLFPVRDSCFKGKKEVGKPKKYEYKEKKEGCVSLVSSRNSLNITFMLPSVMVIVLDDELFGKNEKSRWVLGGYLA
jgi:CRISPR/Cas system-associated endoribonuclease Cas2